ncbi:very long chain fatty acid elongase 7-like [Macrobrachium rosenbergii]|uniref:very long chain fatty acid elongase 7-like n=1 Tax=Macrobrachium rosenbergii TaxID=79674 RepID=UPI0034D53506
MMCYFYGNMSVAEHLPKDPRQAAWLVSKSPLPTLAMCLAYLAVVTWVGPKYMRNRQPIRGLRAAMMIYNAFQVVFNFWIFYGAAANGWLTTYSLFCEPCSFSSQSESAVRFLHVSYWYYISKLVDFIDTIFFVVHKKYDHISLLHVSHHALMPVSTWFGLRYQPGGHATFMGFLNSFVHVVMYSYYLLAAMGPRIRPYLWWKKYITTIQMVQFVAMFIHSFVPVIFLECNVPPELSRWVGAMALVFQILFTDYYVKAYQKKGLPFEMCKLHSDLPQSQSPNGYRSYGVVQDPGPQTGAIRKGSVVSDCGVSEPPPLDGTLLRRSVTVETVS